MIKIKNDQGKLAFLQWLLVADAILRPCPWQVMNCVSSNYRNHQAQTHKLTKMYIYLRIELDTMVTRSSARNTKYRVTVEKIYNYSRTYLRIKSNYILKP